MSTKNYSPWLVSLAVIFSMLFPVMMTSTPVYAQPVDVIPVLGGVIDGTERRITNEDPLLYVNQYDPAISGDIIVYTYDSFAYGYDVWYYDLATNTEQQIPTSPGVQELLADVSNGLITYSDFGLRDIFIYDTATGTTTDITNSDGSFYPSNSAIGGTLVAWEDVRGSAPTYYQDIYAKDLSTGEGRQISDLPGIEWNPAVSGGIIVFQNIPLSSSQSDIYAYDWATGTTHTIENTILDAWRPDTNGQAVVYSGTDPNSGEMDIYYFDLATGIEKRLRMVGEQSYPHISGDYVTFDDRDPITGRFHVRLWHVPTNTVYDLNVPSTANQYSNNIDGNRIVYSDTRNFDLLDIYLYEFEFIRPEPDIDVYPLVYSFGDVKVGTTGATIVTITNTGNTNLAITNIEDPDNFFWYKVSVGLNSIPPGGTGEIYVYFSPQSPGSFSYILKIYSNDPDEGLVEVTLSGNGVSAEVPPDQQIDNILDFMEQSIASGTLVGSGNGNSANGRLGALINMIEAAGDLIDQGRIAEARQQLQDAYLRVDGNPRPPDFATGPAAAELATLIQQLITSLGG